MHFGLLVRDGHVMGVMKKSDFLYLFDSHARNSLRIPDESGTTVVLKFSELGECQTHVETLGHCLNVKIFEITSVHIHADKAQFPEQSHMKREGVEILSKVSVRLVRNVQDRIEYEVLS